MDDANQHDELYPIAVLIDELKVRCPTTRATQKRRLRGPPA